MEYSFSPNTSFFKAIAQDPIKQLIVKPSFLFAQSIREAFKAAAGNTCTVSPPLGQPASSSEQSL